MRQIKNTQEIPEDLSENRILMKIKNLTVYGILEKIVKDKEGKTTISFLEAKSFDTILTNFKTIDEALKQLNDQDRISVYNKKLPSDSYEIEINNWNLSSDHTKIYLDN